MTSPAGPPTQHQLALMIWLAVFPTLTAAQPAARRLAGDAHAGRAHLRAGPVAVPIVTYGLMPQLQRGRRHLLARTAGQPRVPTHGVPTQDTPYVPSAATTTPPARQLTR